MTALTVLYLRETGHPLGAASTTAPGEPPALGGASLRVTLPIRDPVAPPQLPGKPKRRPITLDRDAAAIAVVEADFGDPLDVFQWRVVETTTPDNQVQHRLERLGTGQVTVSRTGPGQNLHLVVPKLGFETVLMYEVRSESGFVKTGRLVFGDEDTKEDDVQVTDKEAFVVLVQGYAPTVLPKP